MINISRVNVSNFKIKDYNSLVQSIVCKKIIIIKQKLFQRKIITESNNRDGEQCNYEIR